MPQAPEDAAEDQRDDDGEHQAHSVVLCTHAHTEEAHSHCADTSNTASLVDYGMRSFCLCLPALAPSALVAFTGRSLRGAFWALVVCSGVPQPTSHLRAAPPDQVVAPEADRVVHPQRLRVLRVKAQRLRPRPGPALRGYHFLVAPAHVPK